MRNFLKKNFSSGFTLVETMVVILILGFLVALAFPNFLRIRMNTNEQLMLSDLRVFSHANESYRASQNSPVYAPDIATLMEKGYINNAWLDPNDKNGYSFVYSPSENGATYSMEADALKPSPTGVNYYCVDQTGVIVGGFVSGLGTAAGCAGRNPNGV